MPMAINPYLFFDGTCAEALGFYAELLGGEVTALMRYGDHPDPATAPADSRDRIMHGCLDLGGRMLMASDAPAGHFRPMQGFNIVLNPTDPAEAERLFTALAEGGQVVAPLVSTFWAARFGMVTDRFGTPWMINCVTGG